VNSILILEANIVIANELKEYLSIDVCIATTESEALELTYNNHFDIYVFDYHSGINLLKELRDIEDNTHSIFILDYYDISLIEKLYQVGDDFLVRPFFYEELKIKTDYIIRKIYKTKSNIINYKSLYYHIITKQLFKKEQKIHLAPMQTQLLEIFLKSIHKPIQKDVILQQLYHNENRGDGSLRVYISQLKKIGFDITYNRISGYVLN
jgi:DNA-binding response OmpR family regulator